MIRLLREPLVHFLILGAALFVVARVADPLAGIAREDSAIVVPSERVEQLAAIFVKTWHRPPTEAELEGLIDDYVLEEAYYREAKALGLDENDTVVRRRLRQKMEMTLGDIAAFSDPGDAVLDAYRTGHASRFSEEARFDFRQVFFDPGMLDPGFSAADILASLRRGEIVEGHRTLLPERVEDASSRAVDSTFGRGFAERLERLPVVEWSGPVESGFGVHFLFVHRTVPGRLPPLAEIREEVLREWTHERQVAARRKFERDLVGRYEVEIEWPQSGEGERP